MAVHVKAEINERLMARLIEELGLKNPPKFQLNFSGAGARAERPKDGGWKLLFGKYSPQNNLVRLVTDNPNARTEGLRQVTEEFTFTILHEMRHAWQRERWSEETQKRMAAGEYEKRGEEADANAFATDAYERYRGLVKVTRRIAGGKSGFAKMGAVAARHAK